MHPVNKLVRRLRLDPVQAQRLGKLMQCACGNPATGKEGRPPFAFREDGPDLWNALRFACESNQKKGRTS